MMSSYLDVADLCGLDGRVDDSLSATHGVEEELLGREALRDESMHGMCTQASQAGQRGRREGDEEPMCGSGRVVYEGVSVLR